MSIIRTWLAVLLVLFTGCLFGAHAIANEPAMHVESHPFGRMADGTAVEIYTFSNGRGLDASVLTLGAALHTVSFPDRAGKSAVITLHLDSVEDRVKDLWATGAIVGRFANRIANATFNIDGVDYKLPANAGKHQIHGGAESGYQRLVWKAEPIDTANEDATRRFRGELQVGPPAVGVRLQLISPDGQGGYPGTAKITVTYTVNAKNELTIDYTATTDKATYINLTNHAYWNLAGADSGDVKSHVLHIQSDKYLVVDDALIPTGEIRDVKGTPLDFTAPASIGSRVDQMPKKHYDACYVLSKPATGSEPALAARVVEPTTGRVMEVLTTQPGLQFFTGHPKAFCLEAQHYPDSPHQPTFPTTLLRPGEMFHQQTVHRFSIQP